MKKSSPPIMAGWSMTSLKLPNGSVVVRIKCISISDVCNRKAFLKKTRTECSSVKSYEKKESKKSLRIGGYVRSQEVLFECPSCRRKVDQMVEIYLIDLFGNELRWKRCPSCTQISLERLNGDWN